MEEKLPFGIRWTRAVDLGTSLFWFLLGLSLILPYVIVGFKSLAGTGGGFDFGFGSLMVILMSAIPCAIGVWHLRLSRRLSRFEASARRWQIAASFASLFAFLNGTLFLMGKFLEKPSLIAKASGLFLFLLLVCAMGTLGHGVTLFFMLVHRRTKQSFRPGGAG